MKNFIISAIFFLIFANINANIITLKTDKAEYLRYEVVNIFCSYIPQNTKLNILTPNSTINFKSSEGFFTVFYKNKPVKTIGNLEKIPLQYIPSLNKWVGKWPIPWNPDLGTYKIFVILKINNKKYAANTSFEIKGRVPPKLPPGFCVMDIEPGDSIIKRVPGVGGKSVKIWENYLLWAKFMGANALWHCVGQSQIWNKFEPSNFPWDNLTLNQIKPLAQECHKYNIKYGAYIIAYLLMGNRQDLSPYESTTGYDKENDTLRKLIYISIYDQKRQEDIIKLLQKLDAIPEIDFLGLDYMRTDFGGYEYVDDFVKEMPIFNLPGGWENFIKEEKMLWLAHKLEIEKNPEFEELWQWWRAHKMSLIIKEIKLKSNVKKPLWLFSLTWKQGKEHGQDPLMFIDAGIDINAGMFYSIDKKTYPHMIESWRQYLKHFPTSLVAGQCVDWNLLGRTFNPSGPEEHFLRQKHLVDKLLPVNPSLGLFWHDLTRAFKTTRGPYSALEWAIAGATSFTYLRQKQHLFPFEVKWNCPDSVKVDEIFTIEINLKNSSSISMDYYVRLIELVNLEMFGDLTQKFYLSPEEVKTITFQVKIMQKDIKKDNRQMIAFMIQYGDMSTQQRYFDFKYIGVY